MTLLARLSRIEARLDPDRRWPWAEREHDRIAAHWARRLAARPAMFDGPVLLARGFSRGFSYEDGVGRLSLFRARYAELVALLDFGPPEAGAMNVFAAAAPRGRDGGYLLGLMADHTANAGQLYFPCGTPDPADLAADGGVDLAGSALRELAEETGLAEGRGLAPGGHGDWLALRDGHKLGLVRTVALTDDAATARERALAHLAAEAEPELTDIVIAYPGGDPDPRLPDYARAFLADAFSLPSQD